MRRMMRAVQVVEYGDAEKLEVSEVERPEPGSRDVLVRVEWAGINFIDIYMRRGFYKKSSTYENALPFTLGMEASGTVVRIGSDVRHVHVGDRVAYCLSPGGYGDYAVVAEWRVVKVPPGVALKSAAAVMLQGCTAHYLCRSLFALRESHSCLVHAGAGGVGQLLIQLAKRQGAYVVTTVGSETKGQVARKVGADEVILYRERDFAAATRAATHGAGVDVVYDSVGRDTFVKSLRSLKRRGLCVLYGASSGPVECIDPILLAERGSLFVTRPHLADYLRDAAEIDMRTSDLFEAISRDELSVCVDREFELEEVREAHRYVEARKSTGKVLLHVVGGT